MFPRIKLLRKNNNLKQIEIANLLNISRETYCNFETNQKIIPLKHLVVLCNYYNTSLNYILGLTENNKRAEYKIIIDKKEIGKRIKLIRIKYNLYQENLAKILNTSQSLISEYESGKKLIITAFAYQLCKTYNISLDWLLNGKGPIFLNI